MHSIYVVTNTVNGKQYVGQTKRDPKTRWKQHVQNAKHVESKPNTNCRVFGRAINKYGAGVFRVEVIIQCNEAHADMYEQRLIAAYRTQVPHGYNVASGGKRFNFNMVPTERRKDLGRPRSRLASGELYIYEHSARGGKTRGYMVRTAEGRYKSFCSMKYSMEQKLEAAKKWLADNTCDYPDTTHDHTLPKFVQNVASKNGYRVEWTDHNGKRRTKSFIDSKLSNDEKRARAIAYAATLPHA